MEKPYTPVNLEQLIVENKELRDGKCFLIVSASPSVSEDDDAIYLSVVASPMSMEMMRGMIMAASYHHNIQEDKFDLITIDRVDLPELSGTEE